MRDVDDTPIPVRIDQRNSLSMVSFTLLHDGKYDLTITYDGNLLPNMPIQILATSETFDRSKVKIYGRGLYQAKVDEEAEFVIDGSYATSLSLDKPIVRLVGTEGNVDVRIRQVEKTRNMFVCSYKPAKIGK